MAQVDIWNEWTKNAEAFNKLSFEALEQASRKTIEYGSTIAAQKDGNSMLKAQADFITENSNSALDYTREIFSLITKPFASWGKSFTDIVGKTTDRK